MRAAAITAALLLAWAGDVQGQTTKTGSISLTLVEPDIRCRYDTTLGNLDFGSVTRNDPCNSGAGVTVHADASTKTVYSGRPSCVEVTGGSVPQFKAESVNATSLTVSFGSLPSSLAKGTHSLSVSTGWAYSENATDNFTTGSGSSLSITGGGLAVHLKRYFRIGGDLTIPAITSDSQYGKYNSTSFTVSVTCS